MDRTEQLIGGLDWYTAWVATQFIDRVRTENQLPIVITSGRRTQAEQERLLAQKRTTTMRSKHLLGLAFDVDMYGWNRDAVPAWVWSEIGPVGESFGLTWGGRWTSFRDVGHFET